MAHFAELDENNNVLRIIVVNNDELLDENGNESEAKGIAFCQSLFGGNWIQTSYNSTIRKRYAAPGMIYNSALDAFIEPKPFPSWTLNEETASWIPPTPRPPGFFIWDEENLVWVQKDP